MGDPDRKMGRPRGGRRVTDPIYNLETHHSAFVGISQLAGYWGFHENTIYRAVRAGRLPAMQLDREYRVRREDALAFERYLFKQRNLA